MNRAKLLTIALLAIYCQSISAVRSEDLKNMTSLQCAQLQQQITIEQDKEGSWEYRRGNQPGGKMEKVWVKKKISVAAPATTTTTTVLVELTGEAKEKKIREIVGEVLTSFENIRDNKYYADFAWHEMKELAKEIDPNKPSIKQAENIFRFYVYTQKGLQSQAPENTINGIKELFKKTIELEAPEPSLIRPPYYDLPLYEQLTTESSTPTTTTSEGPYEW